MVSRKAILVLSILVMASMLLSACQPAAAPTAIVKTVVVEGTPKVIEVVATPEAKPTEPPAPASTTKVLHMNFELGEVSTIDPALATDAQSIQLSQELYVGLTRLMGEDQVVVKPGLATSWEAAADKVTYTFTLRSDVPWVKWDALKGEVVKVQDCEGKDRMVTAQDFEYGMLRALNPATASDYAYLLGFAIAGANDYNSGKAKDAAGVGIKALDASHLQVKFVGPAAYNIMIMGVWTAFATPKWAIEGDDCTTGKGDRWTEQGSHQSYGPFALKEWVHDSSLAVVKNPFWPASDDIPLPKIDEISWTMLDVPAALADFEVGNLDVTVLPVSEIDRIKADPKLSKMYMTTPRLSTGKLVFNTKAPVVNDVRVRRALSMAIDRQSLIDNVLKGGQEVAQWFCRPGLAACPTIDKYPDLGIKYNPDEAKKLLDEYLKENNTTADKLDLTLYYYTNDNEKKMCEAIQAMWKEKLGVDVKLVNQEFKVYLATVRDPKGTPQMWDMGWGADYPDTNNFTREVLASGGSDNPAGGGGINWVNPKFEQLVKDAAVEPDQAKRTEMYAQAEQIAVADDAVIIPIYWRTFGWMTQPYIIRTYEKTSYQLYEKWDIQK